MPRYNLPFGILTSKIPFSKATADSRLQKLMSAIKASLRGMMDDVNIAIDSRLISTANGASLDLHGEILAISRNPLETDQAYQARLLLAFRDIPLGLKITAVLAAIEAITGEVNTIEEYYKSPWLWPEMESVVYGKFGGDTIGASYNNRLTDEKAAVRYQATEDGALYSMRAYLDGEGATRQAYAGLYYDNAGAPSLLMEAASAPVNINSPGWYEFNFNPYPLTSGSYYWLCIGVTGGSWRFYYQSGTANQSAVNNDTPPLDGSFGTPTYNNRAYSIYGIYGKAHSDYGWARMLNTQSSRFVAAVPISPLTSVQYAQIETGLAFKKPAHIKIRLTDISYESYQKVLREIL